MLETELDEAMARWLELSGTLAGRRRSKLLLDGTSSSGLPAQSALYRKRRRKKRLIISVGILAPPVIRYSTPIPTLSHVSGPASSGSPIFGVAASDSASISAISSATGSPTPSTSVRRGASVAS